MRIAMCHSTLPDGGRKPGGVEVYVHRLANALVGRGHEVEVLTHSRRPTDAAYRTRRLPLRKAETNPFLRQYVAPLLLNFEDLEGFDVAHVHGGDWFLVRRQVPVVRTFHGSALNEARSATSMRRRIDQRLIHRLELLAGRMATASYGVGSDSQSLYRTSGILPPGVDLPEPGPQPSPIPAILFVGTWEGRKRGSLLHEVFLREVLPEVPEAELWMVSDHCQESDSVRWIKRPSDAELSNLYSRAWVFCMPSSYEGFGIPYLEAMAHGTPVVATRNPGAEMLLAEGRYGALTDESGLGPELVDLLGNRTRRQRLAEIGRARAGEYTWERSAELHEEAFRDAIERHVSLRRA
jgi:phosphatidyl-myo-inositol alpha-mannosyltransferase